MMQTLTPKNMVRAINDIIKTGSVVPMVKGSPGIGKSDILRQVAKMNKLKYIDIRLAQSDPTDMAGFPVTTGSKMDYVPPAHFPLENDRLPDGYEGWLINFDEINSAPQAVQSAAYKVLLDKQIGQHKIHKKVHMCAAGNLDTDRAVTNRLGTAMQSRLSHLFLEVDNKGWLDWALDNNVDSRIISFIRFRPELLHKFDPSHTDSTFPCPRTWEFASRVLQQNGWEKFNGPENPHHMAVMSGTIGEGAATELKAFLELFNDLPQPEEILLNPTKVYVPENNPGQSYALTSLVSTMLNDKTASTLMKYITRLDMEFQVVCMIDGLKKQPNIRSNKSVSTWMLKSGQELFGDSED